MKLYKLPSDLRKELKKPLGKLVKNESISSIPMALKGARLIICIGDATLERLLELGINPDIFVVDGRVMRREERHRRPKPRFEIEVENPSGTISEEALVAVRLSLKLESEVGVLVRGEEDLLTLPYILLSPPKSLILYGQPMEGIVIVESSSGKEYAKEAMERMGIEEKV